MRWAAPCLVVLCGCSLAAPRSGEPVTPEAARATFEVRARHTEVQRIEVVYPAFPDGTPRPGRHPAVVLVQGGNVEVERYGWLATALATEGYVVALPSHLASLAIFNVEAGEDARRLLREPPEGSLLEGQVDPERIAIAGHSLGGVVGLKLALRGGFGACALLAAFPDPADAAQLPRLSVPTLSLAAERDCSAPLEKVTAGWAQLPGPTMLAVVEGASHYQFTDDDREDRRRGCPIELSLELSHERMSRVLSSFLQAALGGETLRPSTEPGVESELR